MYFFTISVVSALRYVLMIVIGLVANMISGLFHTMSIICRFISWSQAFIQLLKFMCHREISLEHSLETIYSFLFLVCQKLAHLATAE